jgi:agmatinase
VLNNNLNFRIEESLTLGRLKGLCYAYDNRPSSLRRSGTQELSVELFLAVAKLIGAQRKGLSLTRENIGLALEQKDVDEVIAALTLKTILIPQSNGQEKLGFDWAKIDKSYRPATFFNVPAAFPPDKADVHFVSVPLAFDWTTHGSEFGPEMLRIFTSTYCDWFEVFDTGLYSEVGMNGAPRIVAKGIVPHDYATVETKARSLKQIRDDLKEIWKNLGIISGRPIFLGGDHGVTFPIIESLCEERPEVAQDLVIVHFDAHHDYYYFHKVAYHHGAPMYNILETTAIKGVLSFGLRAGHHQTRAFPTYKKAIDGPIKSGRLKQFGVSETISLLNNKEEFLNLIPKNAKIYVSIDLDVLSAPLADGIVSTPAENGLTWDHLFRALNILGSRGDIIGCDLVEYNPMGVKTSQSLEMYSRQQLCALLIEMMVALCPASSERKPGGV